MLNAQNFLVLSSALRVSVLQMVRLLVWHRVIIQLVRADQYVCLFGGNSNMWGNMTPLWVVPKWAKLVHTKLYTGPASAQVANTVINGMVTNHMVFKLVVNVTPKLMYDATVGSLCRTFCTAVCDPTQATHDGICGDPRQLSKCQIVGRIDFGVVEGPELRQSHVAHGSMGSLVAP